MNTSPLEADWNEEIFDFPPPPPHPFWYKYERSLNSNSGKMGPCGKSPGFLSKAAVSSPTTHLSVNCPVMS